MAHVLRKTVNGQLRPLKDRLTDAQKQRRALRGIQRHITKEQLAHHIAVNQVVTHQFLNRGFLGRLKWILRGK